MGENRRILGVHGFSDPGHVGSLRLAFLNDGLVSARFSRKPDDYLDALRTHGESVSETASVRGSSSRATYTAYDGRRHASVTAAASDHPLQVQPYLGHPVFSSTTMTSCVVPALFTGLCVGGCRTTTTSPR